MLTKDEAGVIMNSSNKGRC